MLVAVKHAAVNVHRAVAYHVYLLLIFRQSAPCAEHRAVMEMDYRFIVRKAHKLHAELLDVVIVKERGYEFPDVIGIGIKTAVQVAELAYCAARVFFLVKSVFTGALHKLIVPQPAQLVYFPHFR